MNQEEWLEVRKPLITASCAPAILNLGPVSALELYLQKLGESEDKDSHQKRRGRALEPAILTLAAEEILGPRGWTLVVPEPFTLVRHPTLPWMAATPDAYYLNSKKDKGLVEAKSEQWNPQVEVHAGPSPAQYAQVQHALEVTGLQSCLLVVLVGGMSLKHCLIGRDEEFIGALIVHEQAFRQRLEHRTPPPPDDSEGASKALAEMYPEITETVVELPEEADYAWDELERVRLQARNTERVRRGAGNYLRSLLQNHRYGMLPSGRILERLRYTQKVQARSVTRLKLCSGLKTLISGSRKPSDGTSTRIS